MSSDIDVAMTMQLTVEGYIAALAEIGIILRVRRDFETYNALRRSLGHPHLNQAFDPRCIKFGNHDFWLLAENRHGEAIATYCLRHFIVDDFYDLIRSQNLWFGTRPRLVDPRFVVACEIPPFGGDVAHEGGCWVRENYRGVAQQPRLSHVLPRLARAIALRSHSFDHTSGMMRNDPRDPPDVTSRKATSLALGACGFARVHRFVDGWFPPEGRNAVMHLCHATRDEAVASIVALPPATIALRRTEFGQGPLVVQNEQLIDMPAVRRQRQQQTGI